MLTIDIDQGIYKEKNSKLLKMKNEKKLCGFSFAINMANFEAFHRNKKLSSNLFFQRVAGKFNIT